MLKISGHSDDIVEANIELETKCSECGHEIEEPTKAVVGDKSDEISAYTQKVLFVIGDDKGGVRVKMFYAAGGCWAASVGQMAEGVPIPWEVRIGSHEYTVEVCVDCPNGTPVKVQKEKVE